MFVFSKQGNKRFSQREGTRGMSVSFAVGILGIILLNIGMLPQLVRIIKYKDSQAISFLNVWMAVIGLFVMLAKSSIDGNLFFMLNYGVALALEVALLFVTYTYRREQ